MYFFGVSVITLTTDFGIRDWFVGVMKGVILGIAPGATVVDLTHEIEAGDIQAAAMALLASYRFFPKGTVHVAVVDPGVGGRRKAIAVRTARYAFVGPDNGVLSLALARERVIACHSLTNTAFLLKPVSQTFHGRDVFAPVAAHLSCGVPLRNLGAALKRWRRLPWPETRARRNGLEGQVIHIDRFGNLITNIETENLPGLGQVACEVWTQGRRLCYLMPFYAAVPKGSPVAVPGSTGFLEIAVNGGSAAAEFGFHLHEKVTVRWKPERVTRRR